MNVDITIQPLATIATPARSVHTPRDQVSERPAERPQRPEQADNQTSRAANPAQSEHKETETDKNPHSRQPATELSDDEQRELEKLKARDREVRAHEAAHKNVAGNLARGNVNYSFETGPDGRRYAVGGEVDIDTSKVAGDPDATIRKAQTIRRAATAPAQPSAQDQAVAAAAGRMEAEARRELQATGNESSAAEPAGGNAATATYQANESPPDLVGSLLDINA